MNRVLRITQAYSQTPWRKQLQGIGMFLAVLVLGALVAIIYLNVTSRAATIGRDIQEMQSEIEVRERSIADQKSQLAAITSDDEMRKRAGESGFYPIEPGEAIYIMVEGYPGRLPASLAPPPMSSVEVIPVLVPDYTLSLLDWFKEQLSMPTVLPASATP
jgi:cell division protein FtsL